MVPYTLVLAGKMPLSDSGCLDIALADTETSCVLVKLQQLVMSAIVAG